MNACPVDDESEATAVGEFLDQVFGDEKRASGYGLMGREHER